MRELEATTPTKRPTQARPGEWVAVPIGARLAANPLITPVDVPPSQPGMEVISNGVKAFRHPESKNAATTSVWMSIILGSLFMGISWMAYHYGILAKVDETVVSQLARVTFGTVLIYYAVQIGTMALLVLAANSAFAGFPNLASILARDGFIPHQMATFGGLG